MKHPSFVFQIDENKTNSMKMKKKKFHKFEEIYVYMKSMLASFRIQKVDSNKINSKS